MTRSAFTAASARLREALITARIDLGLTQAALAAALDRPQSFVSKYERGERRLDFVEVLEVAGVLEIDVCALIEMIREVDKNE